MIHREKTKIPPNAFISLLSKKIPSSSSILPPSLGTLDPAPGGRLKKKYNDECAERRSLYNELIELRGNIRVFCRCRPMGSYLIACGCPSVVEINPAQETQLQFVSTKKERSLIMFLAYRMTKVDF